VAKANVNLLYGRPAPQPTPTPPDPEREGADLEHERLLRLFRFGAIDPRPLRGSFQGSGQPPIQRQAAQQTHTVVGAPTSNRGTDLALLNVSEVAQRAVEVQREAAIRRAAERTRQPFGGIGGLR